MNQFEAVESGNESCMAHLEVFGTRDQEDQERYLGEGAWQAAGTCEGGTGGERPLGGPLDGDSDEKGTLLNGWSTDGPPRETIKGKKADTEHDRLLVVQKHHRQTVTCALLQA